jgi:hypothetical protein
LYMLFFSLWNGLPFVSHTYDYEIHPSSVHSSIYLSYLSIHLPTYLRMYLHMYVCIYLSMLGCWRFNLCLVHAEHVLYYWTTTPRPSVYPLKSPLEHHFLKKGFPYPLAISCFPVSYSKSTLILTKSNHQLCICAVSISQTASLRRTEAPRGQQPHLLPSQSRFWPSI